MPDKKKKADTSKVKELNPYLLELQERLNVPGLGPYDQPANKDLPPIEQPPMVRKQSKLIGFGTPEALELEKLYNLAPQLRGLAPSITSGYGPLYLNSLLNQANTEQDAFNEGYQGAGDNTPYTGPRGKYTRAGKFLEEHTPLTILGRTSIGSHVAPRKAIEVGLQSRPEDFIGTLAHEMQHALGMAKSDQLKDKMFGHMDPVVKMSEHGGPHNVGEPVGGPGWTGHSYPMGQVMGPEQSDELATRGFHLINPKKDVNLPSEYLDLSDPSAARVWQYIQETEKKTGKRYPGKRPRGK